MYGWQRSPANNRTGRCPGFAFAHGSVLGKHRILSLSSDSSETEALIRQIKDGDRTALDRLLTLHRDYAKRIVELRMEDELLARVEPSDVVQETQVVVADRIDDFLQRRPTSFRLWLRRETLEKLIDIRRHHLADKRSIRREVRLPNASSRSIAQRALNMPPSQAMLRKEIVQKVREAIESLGEMDREIILLRYVEELTNAEVAELLEIDPGTARKRLGRALRRLSARLDILGVHRGE